MRTWMRKLGMLTVSLVLAAAILGYGQIQESKGPEYAEITGCTLYIPEEEEPAGPVLNAMLGGEADISIKSWEKDGEYWLFLPAIFRGQEARCGEEALLLEEGEHLLESGSGKGLELEILFGSEIPFAYIGTESGNLQYLLESKENKEKGSLCFVGSDGEVQYAGGLSKVKIRGNATRLQPKSPFRIGLEKSASLEGLGESTDYVLLADYGDISLLRNWAAMELASRTSEQYEVEGQHIDLYMNGEYMGVYLLCEGISLGENRLEIVDMEEEMELLNSRNIDSYETFAEMDDDNTIEKGYEIPVNPQDISGGYLLELEYHGRYETEESTGFRTDRDWSLVIKEPTYASREQVEYIRDMFQHVENAMYASDWIDPDSGLALEELVDMESLVHKYLVDEVCYNTDPWTSQFLYKEKGEDKFCFGPAWDFDMAFGHYDEGFSASDYYANWHIWYGAIYENPEFQRLLKKEYEEEFLPVLTELTDTKLQEKKELLADSAQMNFVRWSVEEIYSRNTIIYTGDSFAECVDWLENFIAERTEFLSSEWLED